MPQPRRVTLEPSPPHRLLLLLDAVARANRYVGRRDPLQRLVGDVRGVVLASHGNPRCFPVGDELVHHVVSRLRRFHDQPHVRLLQVGDGRCGGDGGVRSLAGLLQFPALASLHLLRALSLQSQLAAHGSHLRHDDRVGSTRHAGAVVRDARRRVVVVRRELRAEERHRKLALRAHLPPQRVELRSHKRHHRIRRHVFVFAR